MHFVMFQATSPTITAMLIQAALAILIPIGVTWIMVQVTKANAAVAQWEDWEKRILAAVYGVIVAGIAHALKITLPDSWGALGSADVQAILAALGAMLVHRLVKGPVGVG